VAICRAISCHHFTTSRQPGYFTACSLGEKPNALRVWTWSLSGGINLFDAPSEEWKPLRALFSRGFSANHLMNFVPSIVEETQVYCNILREHAKSDALFYLDTTNVKLMLDVIGRTAL
jgi:hypothetical protein